jgi:hypothetical protein
MLEPASVPEVKSSPGTHLMSSSAPRLPIIPLGLSLGLFLAITYVLCVLFDLWFPALAMNPVWAPLLPGFTWISWANFLLGLIEVFAYGWYIALVFGPLYNFFAMRSGTSIRP